LLIIKLKLSHIIVFKKFPELKIFNQHRPWGVCLDAGNPSSARESVLDCD
jgi:hypothetical protein